MYLKLSVTTQEPQRYGIKPMPSAVEVRSPNPGLLIGSFTSSTFPQRLIDMWNTKYGMLKNVKLLCDSWFLSILHFISLDILYIYISLLNFI